MADLMSSPVAAARRPLYKALYFQVFVAIVLGVALGMLNPPLAEKMKPLGDGFIKLIRMMIAPIIFCTVVTGIAGMSDMKKLGRVGVKALLYFEVVTTAALLIGLAIVTVVRPGRSSVSKRGITKVPRVLTR
ncbi:MAG: cation:dicarboxylase symporter family transporter [Acidobacteriota bacterium]